MALILNRREGEVIRIADDIVVTVLEVRGDRVRLGISAPPTVEVQRWERLTPEQKAAINGDPTND